MARLTFNLRYHTHWGEDLFLERQPDTGAQLLAMSHVGDGLWTLSVDGLPEGERFGYRYVFHGPGGERRREPADRWLVAPGQDTVVHDQWLSVEEPDPALLRQAFAGIIFRPEVDPGDAVAGPAPGWLVLTLRAPRVTSGFSLAITGDHPALGEWDPRHAVVMSGAGYPVWKLRLPLTTFQRVVEFKFGLWDHAAGMLASVESGANRAFGPVASDTPATLVNAEHYRHAQPWKGAGVAIPVFALRSERGYGIGEFADLEPLAGWAADCGLHLVQVLPVNDTSSDFSWKDSYPYKAISTAALHPIYIHLDDLFAEAGLPLPPGFVTKRAALNRLPQLDYETVLQDKLACLRQLYAATGPKTLRSREFKRFWAAEADWLRPYAAFCRLRDQHGTADFSTWGPDATYRAKACDRWFRPRAPEYAEAMFHAFVQYHLKRQLDRALAAGHARRVAFKGDLPIGIDRCSVEAWTQPEWFHMDRQTGAPPDSFSRLGQNWGFPTYNWPRLEASGYAWWRDRFQRMSTCFDALRIDHILGFFRIWEIPCGQVEGILGHFNPTQPLTREELRAAGFSRDPGRFAEPAVAEDALRTFFGHETWRAAEEFLFQDTDGFRRIRPEYAAPQARDAWCRSHCTAAETTRIASGMREVGFEVLFQEDPDRPDRWHPRINFEETRVFQALPLEEQQALRRLHDDFFHRRHSRFWEEEAMKKLPALMDASNMLICGEDLGMIPDSVPVVLKRLGLLSLEVQRMPKRLGQLFSNPQEYPYLSVCTTSTHDLSTLRGMWLEEAGSRQALWRDVLHKEGEAPPDCAPDVCRQFLQQNLAATSMWCILPLQDWLAIDAELRRPDPAAERINVPANPRHYWRYRMHLTLETLQDAAEFNRGIAHLVAEAGRSPTV